jgi:hypothetical protein
MNATEHARHENLLARAIGAERRAETSAQDFEKKIWEDIARSWRELARQAALKLRR